MVDTANAKLEGIKCPQEAAICLKRGALNSQLLLIGYGKHWGIFPGADSAYENWGGDARRKI